MKKVLRIILLIVCICVFIYSALQIASYFVERGESKKIYDDIASKSVTIIPPKDNVQVDELEQPQNVIEVDFEILKKQYKDITAWIYLPNSKINYPVVKSHDNAEYLKLMPNGKYNVTGSIFADCRNGAFLQDRNYIIYGHNMKNDSMFGSLSEYKKQKYYEAHKIIYYTTPEKQYELHAFAGFVTDAVSQAYKLYENEEELAEYLNGAKQKSTFKSDVNYTEGDKIVTLSTCSSDFDNARYVLITIVKEIEQ